MTWACSLLTVKQMALVSVAKKCLQLVNKIRHTYASVFSSPRNTFFKEHHVKFLDRKSHTVSNLVNVMVLEENSVHRDEWTKELINPKIFTKIIPFTFFFFNLFFTHCKNLYYWDCVLLKKPWRTGLPTYII